MNVLSPKQLDKLRRHRRPSRPAPVPAPTVIVDMAPVAEVGRSQQADPERLIKAMQKAQRESLNSVIVPPTATGARTVSTVNGSA